MIIILTYGWVRSSYAALRNLHSHGIRVVVADQRRLGMSQFSWRALRRRRYRASGQNGESFVEAISALCTRDTIDLILASHNETEFLAEGRSNLPEGVDRLLPEVDSLRLFNDKRKTLDLAEQLELSVPRRIEYTFPLQIAQEVKASGAERTVIKLRKGNSSKGVYYADTPEGAEERVRSLIKSYHLKAGRFPLVEERVPGVGWGCSVLYWEGECIATFTHRRLREKIATGGTSTLREAAEHEGIERDTRKLFDHVGWHGLAMAEFKVCPETGEHWLIEVNPRLWGSLPLAIEAGVEFPYLAVLCATEGPEAAKRYAAAHPPKIGHRARWLLGDLTVGMKALLRGRIRDAWEVFSDFSADSTDDWFWDDPLVFPGEVASYGATALRARSLNAEEEGMVG